MLGSVVLSFSAQPVRRRPTPLGPDGGASAGQAVSSIRVLVVEDDDDLRTGLAEILSDDGFEVRVAPDGAAALKLLRSTPAPDVIVLDLMMPVMDGWRFRVEQKRDPLLASIPVIAMSASASSQAEAIDAAAFASKPLQFAELRQAIDRVVSKTRAARVEHTDRLAALGTLTAGVAHEINNALTYVIANLDVLAGELSPSVEPPYAHWPALLSAARDGARRITDIVRNVQTIARASHDPATSVVDLRACVEHSVKILRHEVGRRAELRLDLNPVALVRGNAGRLEQVIINLLINALHAVGERGGDGHVITLRTVASANGRVRFEISDTGPGVPEHLTAQIFEPFLTTRPPGVGTGLGLSICRSIIQDHGGEIGVLRAPDGGALFWFEIPQASPTES